MKVERGIVSAVTRWSLAALWACALAACSGGGSVNVGSGQAPDPATVDFPIFYVKRTIPQQSDDLRQLRDTTPQANLFKRERAAPGALETNITERVTGTDNYDVKDVDVSFDGKKVVFAMRGPLADNQDEKDPPTWNIWEYDLVADDLHRLIQSDTTAEEANDVSPHYLPDGRIVFSSTRQRISKAILLDENKPQFEAQTDDRSESAFVLHVMDSDGNNIKQISFNQSHDRDASVLSSGRLVWSRWDHAPGNDGIHLYTANPDGTGLELLYGANSHDTGSDPQTPIQFTHPREMQDGRILSLVRPYTDTDFGGDLVIIDTNTYVENTQPTLANAGLAGPAQTRATTNDVRTVQGPSPGGRFNSAYPLWDGTNRILTTWTQCRLLDATTTPATIVPCTDARLADPNVQIAPSIYSVWMFDPGQNTFLPIMTPTEDVMVTDVVAAQPRAMLPPVILDKQAPGDLDPTFVSEAVGVLDIKSVYDFDGVDNAQPNLATIADPGQRTADQRPARFIRLEKAVSQPDRDVRDIANAAFGVTPYMREILGYAPVEPDGSVKIKVPANVAFQISVLDSNGRRISPSHDNWLQVRPGEVLTCNGCHQPATAQNPRSHGRSGLFDAVNKGATTTGQPFPNTDPTFSPDAGETMAETRARQSCASDNPRCAAMTPSVNVVFTDVWTDPALRAADPPVLYSYADPTFTTPAPTSSCVTGWNAQCRIVIDYVQHIQPLWDKPRQVLDPMTMAVLEDHTCSRAGCHNTVDAMGAAMVPGGQLDLQNVASDEEPLQLRSYRELFFTDNEQEVMMGALVDRLVPGPPDQNGNPTQVTVGVGPYLNGGSARGTLSAAFLGRFAPGSGSTHAGYLSPAELRLLSEWLDIGAQYFNNPFDPAVPLN
jgi:Hydrazine synthase alpha subunit middle domain/WD40-like Beta Propeller Repeat